MDSDEEIEDIETETSSTASSPPIKKHKPASKRVQYGFSEANFKYDAPFILKYPTITPAWLMYALAMKGGRIGKSVSSFYCFFFHYDM